MLLATSEMPRSRFLQLFETFISIGVIGLFMNSLFVLIYVYTSELFPTRMRGLANAVVLLTGKVAGSFSPYLISFTIKMGYNLAIGCSLIVLLSLPLSFGLRETLVEEKEEEATGMEGAMTDIGFGVEDG